MKLALPLLALTACISPLASAQSSVTVYGSIDGGIRSQTNVDAAGHSLQSTTSGNYYSNRLGFRGAEQIGNGLNVHFQLESGFNDKTGELDNTNNVLFNRTAALGIGGGWGVLDLGRQYTVAFKTEKFLDPFDHNYTGIVPLSSGAGTTLPAAAKTAGLSASSSSGTRFNNDIQYAGSFGPFTLRAEYAPGELAGDAAKGTARALAASYAGAVLLAAGAYTHKQTPLGFANDAWVAGGGAKLMDFTVKLAVSRERQDTATATTYQNTTRFDGVSYQVRALTLTAAVYRSAYEGGTATGNRRLVLLGASYALSKRSNLYSEIDLNRYEGALLPASKQDRQNGVSVGLNHLF
jgi:predicted porin